MTLVINGDNKVELDNWSNLLLSLCEQHVVFDPLMGKLGRKDNLLNSGLIDSMGLIYLQDVIQQEFGVDIPIEILITELRDIEHIAGYLYLHVPPERAPKFLTH